MDHDLEWQAAGYLGRGGRIAAGPGADGDGYFVAGKGSVVDF